MKKAGIISETDEKNLIKIRQNVRDFVERSARSYDAGGLRVLDIAPQDHAGAKPYFKKAIVETLDIDEDSGATYIADLCANNQGIIPSDYFDLVVCTEVLEHTLQPFNAVDEIRRIIKPGGLALVSTPYDLRIHGPLPDCWRFTEHGLRALFGEFKILRLTALENPERFLMPTHYTLVARKGGE